MNSPARLPLACALLALLPLACQRAGRYRAAPLPAETAETKPAGPSPAWAWLPVQERPDLPLRFISDASPDWAELPKFMNPYPGPAAGMRTIHLGLSPLEAAAAMVLADSVEVVKIKVPRGLPDPTPLLPEANPPTFGRWQLGKKIFAEARLKAGSEFFTCADCHKPEHGYTQAALHPPEGVLNTLSLLNVVYNRRQFWDGRVRTLEETVVRSLSDEQPASVSERVRSHRWGGLVKALAEEPEYREQFQRVFGIEQPTQDAIAKALATYMRTLLLGNSLYDRAEAERQRQKAAELTAAHFLPLLDDKTLAGFSTETEKKLAKEDAARQLAQRGAGLFFGKARCVACHPGPLFTDHDFHNVGLGSSDSLPRFGEETGRFAVVPIGLKEARLIGAFRTPTLRNLPRTGPYFHDGMRDDVRLVVRFFNLHVDTTNRYLARVLREAGPDGHLDLDVDDMNALVLFLQALNGEAGAER